MTKQVAVNYSPEMIAKMTADYAADKPLSEIAENVGKSVASVRAKLSSLGIYKPKEKPAGKKAGVTKAGIVADIAAIVVGNRDGLESLQAATLSDLNALLAFLVAEMRESEELPPLE